MTLWLNELGERLWRKHRSSTVETSTPWGRGQGTFSVPNCGKRSSYRSITLIQFFLTMFSRGRAGGGGAIKSNLGR